MCSSLISGQIIVGDGVNNSETLERLSRNFKEVIYTLSVFYMLTNSLDFVLVINPIKELMSSFMRFLVAEYFS